MKTTNNGYMFQRPPETGIYYLQYNVNGSRKIVSLKTDDLELAEKRRKEILGEASMLNTKEKVIVHIAENRKLISNVRYKLEEAWDKYEATMKRPDSSKGTLDNYRRNWEKFKTWLKEKYPKMERMNQVTPVDADLYMGSLWDANCAAATYNYHLFSLKHIYKVLGGGNENPFAKLKPKHETHESFRKGFTLEQVNKILSAFDNPELELVNKAEMKTMFYLGAYTGARQIDCALMRRDSINLTQRTISYIPIKTKRIGRRVTIPIMSNVFYSHLETCMKETKGSDYLLPAVSARYLKNKDGVNQDAIKVLDFCGIRKMKDRTPKSERETVKIGRGINDKVEYGFHSFRHFVGTMLASQGKPVKTVADMLGDDVRTASKYYIHVSDEEKKVAMQGLLLAGDDKPETDVIDIKAVSELEDMQKRFKIAVELLKQAPKKDIAADFRKQLIKVLHQ